MVSEEIVIIIISCHVFINITAFVFQSRNGKVKKYSTIGRKLGLQLRTKRRRRSLAKVLKMTLKFNKLICKPLGPTFLLISFQNSKLWCVHTPAFQKEIWNTMNYLSVKREMPSGKDVHFQLHPKNFAFPDLRFEDWWHVLERSRGKVVVVRRYLPRSKKNQWKIG